ncbi:cation transporter [uncultured Ilyobacter sp.]|uniref:heavy-metal-associated domain-containing protein n=1 Tax=uncultured Ilyobacter sp. TaxID=544433 RepID=UPI0029C92B8C|nr:cation transporter [uncultured Ilyobacter sp.]
MKRIKIEGMMCDHCVNAVSKALKSVEGISEVKVILKEKEAIVNGTAPENILKEAIEKEGYTVISIEDIDDREPSEKKKDGIFSKIFKKISNAN